MWSCQRIELKFLLDYCFIDFRQNYESWYQNWLTFLSYKTDLVTYSYATCSLFSCEAFQLIFITTRGAFLKEKCSKNVTCESSNLLVILSMAALNDAMKMASFSHIHTQKLKVFYTQLLD